jgi:hypothetical protein
MKNSTTHRLLFILLFLLAGNSLKAQVSALTDLNAGTLAAYCPLEQVKLTAASTGAVSYVWKRYVGTSATGTATTLAGTTANLTDAPTVPGYYTYVFNRFKRRWLRIYRVRSGNDICAAGYYGIPLFPAARA